MERKDYNADCESLDINTVSVADLSSDGRWLAVTVGLRRDNLGVDGSRDNDPTYVRGAPVRLLVVDTRSLAQRAVFNAKKPVRTAVWSPDGSRLALLTVEGEDGRAPEPLAFRQVSGNPDQISSGL